MTTEVERTPLIIPWDEIPGGRAIIEGKGLTRQQHCYILLGLQMVAYYQALNAHFASSQGVKEPFFGEDFTALALKGLDAVDKVFNKALKEKIEGK